MSTLESDELVEARPPSDQEIAQLLQIVKACPQPTAKMWGQSASGAFIMELLVSTLSHALNEDLLVHSLRRLQHVRPQIFHAECLVAISERDVARWFSLNENDQSKRNPTRLANLIRTNFRHFVKEDATIVNDLFEHASTRSLSEVCEWLARFPVFGLDPLRKKSALTLQRLYLQGYLPPERYVHMPFAIDRHIVRFFLRTGWISVRTTELAAKVSQRFVLSAIEDMALRSCAHTVMSYLAEKSHIPHAQLNYVTWQFARSYCARRDPGCLSNQPNLLGVRADLTPKDASPCILANWCVAFGRGTVMATLDPLHRGNLY